MERKPTIYVIIPVYKAEKYIAQTLNSVLSQPYTNIEIICVDDGSPDDSISILRDYEKQYENVYVIRQENCGVSRSRNTGIDYALEHCSDGDYLTFLDADDLWTKNSVTEEFVCGNFDSDCVACADVCCTNDLSRTAAPFEVAARHIFGGKESIWCHGDVHMGAVFYACGVIRKYQIRFARGLSYSEDKQFKYACFFLAESINLTNLVLYCYRANPLSAIHQRKHGIDFMPPVIREYGKLREFLRPYENDTRGSAVFCEVLAGVHGLEMCAEHFAHFHSASGLKRFMEANPDLAEAILRPDASDMSDQHNTMRHQYLHAPLQFRLSCCKDGIKLLLRSLLLKNKRIQEIGIRRRYPFPNKYL